jgi:hypothetical protein
MWGQPWRKIQATIKELINLIIKSFHIHTIDAVQRIYSLHILYFN